MKRIDLHIHTVSTPSDPPFEYDFDVLKQYVSDCSLDMIAITNHNQFERKQFEEIFKNLDITVLPGIEIDIENGHLLVITTKTDIDDFETKCNAIHDLIPDSNTSISEAEFLKIFDDLEKYLLIPHYRKSPSLDFNRIPTISKYITIGETGSKKQFITLKKDSTDLVPVYFSDIRIKKGIDSFNSDYTIIDLEETTFSSLKIALLDRYKVAIDEDDVNELFEKPGLPFKISSGLTVVLGARSSGKTYTLNSIAEKYTNPQYIKQFSLLSTDDDKDQKVFEDTLRRKSESVSENFLTEFKLVVDNVKNINLENDELCVEEYLSKLKKAAEDQDKQDIYSKAKLFSEILYDEKDLTSLEKLISSVDTLITNSEYEDIILDVIPKEKLYELSIRLMKKYINLKETEIKKKYVNEIVDSIKRELKVRTAAIAIPEIDFYQVAMNKRKIQRFNTIVNALKTPREISKKSLYSFNIQALIRPFKNAGELKNFSKKMMAFSDVYEKYEKPYEYLKLLKQKEELSDTELYRYFAYIQYKVLNKYGVDASGGERSEYNLLQKLEEAKEHEILILDEPESSFDNLFLRNDINQILKEISLQVPVVVATHNNTIGASVHPDYVLFTEKEILADQTVKYHIFEGYPTNESLKTMEGKIKKRKEVLLNCLEAGEEAYIERKGTYEVS